LQKFADVGCKYLQINAHGKTARELWPVLQTDRPPIPARDRSFPKLRNGPFEGSGAISSKKSPPCPASPPLRQAALRATL
jgi:hypothetical protein